MFGDEFWGLLVGRRWRFWGRTGNTEERGLELIEFLL